MQTFPPVSIHETWDQDLEILAIDDNEPVDLTGVTQITLKLRDPRTKFDEMTLSMNDVDISIVSPGVIEWRVEPARMGVLEPKMYELILLLQDAEDTSAIFVGPVSIVE